MHAKSLLNFVSTQKRKNLSFARLLSFDDTGSKDGRATRRLSFCAETAQA